MKPKLAICSEPTFAVMWRRLATITRRRRCGAVAGERRLRIMDIFVRGVSSSIE
jgi:hypothetical protein